MFSPIFAYGPLPNIPKAKFSQTNQTANMSKKTKTSAGFLNFKYLDKTQDQLKLLLEEVYSPDVRGVHCFPFIKKMLKHALHKSELRYADSLRFSRA